MGKPTDALLLESNLNLDGANVVFGRAEYVRKNGADLAVQPAGTVFDLGAISLGYLRNFELWNAVGIAPGAMLTVDFVDRRLDSFYHSQTPVGLVGFVRIRPAMMHME
jgi:hypothetical protein